MDTGENVMNDGIQVMIGIGDEVNHMPIGFIVFDDGVSFDTDYTAHLTRGDLEKSRAILLDLADAITAKIATMIN